MRGAVGAEFLEGEQLAALGLTAEIEDAAQLLGPFEVEQRVDVAFVDSAFLHAAFEGASAADGPERVRDGADAVEFKFAARGKVGGQFGLESFKGDDVVGRYVHLGGGEQRRWHRRE